MNMLLLLEQARYVQEHHGDGKDDGHDDPEELEAALIFLLE